MRLKEHEVSAIVDSMAQVFPNHGGHIFLYGSRARDDLKGGDIDLCLIVKDPSKTNEYNRLRARCVALIMQKIGEQKIDLSIISSETAKTDAFWKESLVGAMSLTGGS